jgi:hypothetical protein
MSKIYLFFKRSQYKHRDPATQLKADPDSQLRYYYKTVKLVAGEPDRYCSTVFVLKNSEISSFFFLNLKNQE